MARLSQIEELRALRDMFNAGSAQVLKTGQATIAQFEKEAAAMGINMEPVRASLEQVRLAFLEVGQQAAAAQLQLIDYHKSQPEPGRGNVGLS